MAMPILRFAPAVGACAAWVVAQKPVWGQRQIPCLSVLPSCIAHDVMSRRRSQLALRCDMRVPAGGNLRFPVQQQHLSQAQSIIDQVHSGMELADALRQAGEAPKEVAPKNGCANAKNLVVFYTDFEPDDVLAVAQILEWKAKLGSLEQHPIIVFCADFKTKDGGEVFEKKLLMAALALGITDYSTLTYEGDEGDSKAFDGSTHPKAKDLAAMRKASISSICDQLAKFKGERIDLYLMAPGHGNLGAIVAHLQQAGEWPLRPKWRVSMYSGSFNTRGMSDADLHALEEIMTESDAPLLDMSKFPFFGGRSCHPVTASLGTFSCPSFGANLVGKAPLLAAAWMLFNEEFNQGLIHPTNKMLFRGSELDSAEEKRFAEIQDVFYRKGVKAYAQALRGDAGLWKKVVSYKQSTVDAFASGACDSPLCDQLLFLYEWLAENRPHWLAPPVTGKWCLDRKSGFTSVDSSAQGGIRAIQPVLQNTTDEARLKEIQEVMQSVFFQHVQTSKL